MDKITRCADRISLQRRNDVIAEAQQAEQIESW